MPIAIRVAHGGDEVDLARLITELGYPTTAPELEARLPRMDRTYYRTFVAVEGDNVVGFIGLLTLPVYEHETPIGWILALCVAQEFRGRGIGKALLGATEEHYRANGVTDIRLHSGFQRDSAHEFYEKMGFDKSGYRFKKKLV
jgi:GNAT superfamily N-acetyltransferase